MNELEKLALPLATYLRKNHNPHCSVIITDSHVRIVTTEISLPIYITTSGDMGESCQSETIQSQERAKQ